MLNLILCIAGILLILLIAEMLHERKVLKGEYLRKLVHIAAGGFIAFWPWLISFQTITYLGVAMLAIMLANRYIKFFHYHGHMPRPSYGDYFFAVAIIASSLLTDNNIFFAIAILEVAVADGLAAVAGTAYGKQWGYKVLGFKKTVIGSMVFWIATTSILTAGLLAAHENFTFETYYYLLLLLPPGLTLLENFAVYGIDNLLIPVALIGILNMAQI